MKRVGCVSFVLIVRTRTDRPWVRWKSKFTHLPWRVTKTRVGRTREEDATLPQCLAFKRKTTHIFSVEFWCPRCAAQSIYILLIGSAKGWGFVYLDCRSYLTHPLRHVATQWNERGNAWPSHNHTPQGLNLTVRGWRHSPSISALVVLVNQDIRFRHIEPIRCTYSPSNVRTNRAFKVQEFRPVYSANPTNSPVSTSHKYILRAYTTTHPIIWSKNFSLYTNISYFMKIKFNPNHTIVFKKYI